MQPAVRDRGEQLPALRDQLLRCELRPAPLRHLGALRSQPGPPSWTLAELLGRLVELSSQRASAALSLALRVVPDAQRQGEQAAWVGGRASTFYPPDAAELGVDLAALVVVRLPRDGEIALAGEWLARSGSFGLVVLDLTRWGAVPMALQSRLLAQAQKHDLAVLCLTEKASSAASLSSLVSLRAEARLRRRTTAEQDAGQAAAGAGASFECELAVLKDKRRSRLWSQVEVARGTPGLR